MNRIVLTLGVVLATVQLSSCTTAVDVKHPTVAQQDQLDVQWGLAPRQSKGGAKRLYAAPDGLPAQDPAQSGAPQTLPTTPAP